MNHDCRLGNVNGSGASPPSDAWIFAQQLLGKPITRPPSKGRVAGIDPEQLAWLESVSPDSIDRLRDSLREEHDPTVERSQLEWLAEVSSRHENQLRRIRILEAAAEELQSRSQRSEEGSTLQEAQWDPGKHPRRGGQPNAGWFATTGGSGGSTRAGGSSSFFDAVIRRNQAIAGLTGRQTPGMAQSSRFAADLQSAARLPGEVARAAAAGLGTGGKALVNASATAVKNVATLGLSTSQLELIGVTKEDRARGYGTAVTIATASGEVLIAVGTAGIATALSKGGSVAKTASGALIAYDAAGNAVGVVQGTYDASKNGVNLSNGAQVAAGALGLGANVSAARGLKSTPAAQNVLPSVTSARVDEFVSTLPRKSTPSTTPANQYEIRHTGPYNYTISGGGATFAIDGYRGSTILESKFVNTPSASPYVPGSSIPGAIREEILKGVRGELQRIQKIIRSGSTPFTSVEIITNSAQAKGLFEGILKEFSVPGSVRVEP